MVKFYIDTREHGLEIPECEKKQLELGDFQVVDEEEKPLLILERKTIADLEASVKDSRYKEQKMRMLSLRESTRCKLVYLIEGTFSFTEDTVQKKINTSCILNTIVRDDIPVIFSKNLEDTAHILHLLIKRIMSDPAKYFETSEINVDALVQGKLKAKKKDNIDEKTCFMMQLCAIPGVSLVKASSIIEAKNIYRMNDFCSQMSHSKPKDFFENVPGVGKVLQANIYRFCGIDPDSK